VADPAIDVAAFTGLHREEIDKTCADVEQTGSTPFSLQVSNSLVF
jgi:hypothetical protein